MTNMVVPEPLTIDTLEEHGIRECEILSVAAGLIEFHDKTSATVANKEMLIDQEGLKELGGFVGISKQYLNRLPDDLFSYTMNYFYRRAEDAIIELIVDQNVIVGVQLEGAIRLSLEYIVLLIKKACNGETPLFSSFERKNGNYAITILPSKIETDDTFLYDAVTIHLNDRLFANPSYHLGIYDWGPLIKLGPYMETAIAKNETAENVISRFEEDLAFTCKSANSANKHAISVAKETVLEDPRTIIKKLAIESGAGRHADKLLDQTSIDNTPIDCYSAAKIFVQLSTNDRLTKNQKRRVEDISGQILTSLPEGHRCEFCYSNVDEAE